MRVIKFLIVLVPLLVCCKSTKKKIAIDYQSDQIELDLADKMKPQRIEASFYSLGIKWQCTLDKASNLNVYAYDTEKKSMEEILQFMGNEVGVQSARRTKGCKTE